MGRVKAQKTSSEVHKTRPARTPEARENQLIAKAWDRIEERIDNGTATASELLMVAKLGTQKERLEMELNQKKMELMTAKTEALQSAKRIEALYGEAMAAFRRYSGVDGEEEGIEDDADLY